MSHVHELQKFAYSSAELSSCTPQNQITKQPRKRDAVYDFQNNSEYKRLSYEDLREKENCSPGKVVINEVDPFFSDPDILFFNLFPGDLTLKTETDSCGTVSRDSLDFSDSISASPEQEQSAFGADEVKNMGDHKSFAMVPSRTALLSESVKYSVTMGELKRRINAPECLHASLINGILRKAKAKYGGDDLRKNLQTMGIELPHGRRKFLPNTSFTALTETEAIHIAVDYKDILRREFRSKEIAAHMIECRRQLMIFDRNIEIHRLNDVKTFCMDLQRVISRVGEHPSEYNEKENHEEIDKHVNHFSLVTHGFGNIAMSGLLDTIIRMVDESQSMLETPEGYHPAQQPLGQHPQGHQQYVSPAMQLPNPGFMGMGYAPFMGAPQYIMGQGAQPPL